MPVYQLFSVSTLHVESPCSLCNVAVHQHTCQRSLFCDFRMLAGMHHPVELHLTLRMDVTSSGVARAFPGGQAAHPEDQNEEEN